MWMFRSIVIIVAGAFLVTGCGANPRSNSVDKKPSKPSVEASGLASAQTSSGADDSQEKESQEDGVDEPVTIEEDDGSKTTYTGLGTLPPNFPKDVLVHPSAKVQSSVSGSGEENAGLVVGFDATEAPTVIFAWYRTQMVKSGWEIEMSVTNPDGGLIVATKDTRTVSIAVGAGGAVKTKFSVTLERRSSGD